MNRTIRIAVTLVAVLIMTGCDSGTGSVVNTGASQPRPSNGLAGTAAKGVISDATITVTDAAGAAVPIASGASTGAGGSYSLAFTEAAVAAGINPPLTVTVTGGTATCDYDEPDTASDCGDGIAFGSGYSLPEGFQLAAIVPSLPANTATSQQIVTVNVTPATDLAAAIANATASGSALTQAEVLAANRQMLGLIQTLTGVDMSGTDLLTIPVIDLTSLGATTDSAPDASYALMAFAVALIAEIDPTDPDADTLPEAIARLKSDLAISQETSNLVASGFVLGRFSRSLSASLATINAQLVARGNSRAAIVSAEAIAASNEGIYAALGSTVIGIPNLFNPDPDTEALNLTRAFVATFSEVITSIMATTGAQGFGGDTPGATELFAAELDVVRRLNSGGATIALRQLESALIEAEAGLEAGATEVDSDDSDGVTGTMTKSADGTSVTIANITSSWADSTTGVTTTLSIPNGERVNGSTLTTENVTLKTTEGGVLLETFTGELAASFAPEAGDIGLKSLAIKGVITGQTEDRTFGIDLALTGLSGITAEASSGRGVSGDYSATFSFTSNAAADLSVTLFSEIHATTISFTLKAGDNMLTGTASRTGDTNVETFTDGSVTLTVTLDLSQGPGQLVSAILTVGTGEAAVQTGTIDANGVVVFTDGSLISLPAAVF